MNVLLDLDGTLTDPAEGITRCIQHALSRIERPIPNKRQLLDWVGPPLHESFLEHLEGDEALASRAVTLYRERFSEVGLFENAVYPGIESALETLRSRGASLFVATSKPLVYAERIVRHFRLERWLDDVFGSELDGRRTNKVELITHVLEATGCDPAETVMVGDRRHDAQGARANAVYPVGAGWGYGSRQELIGAGVSKILTAPVELAGLMLPDHERRLPVN